MKSVLDPLFGVNLKSLNKLRGNSRQVKLNVYKNNKSNMIQDTEKFIATGESLLTPYEWGRYDLLVLPPSFPYGGMEVSLSKKIVFRKTYPI